MVILVVLILVKSNNDEKKVGEKNLKLGLILIFISLIVSAVSTIIVKFAAISVNQLAFIAISYLLNVFFSFGLIKKLQTKSENPKHKNALIIGFFIGLFNFAGFYVLLKALAIGPLSLIASINSLYFVIPIILSILIYKEKITSRRLIGLSLSIIAIILMRL